jgi:hypothetical protein
MRDRALIDLATASASKWRTARPPTSTLSQGSQSSIAQRRLADEDHVALLGRRVAPAVPAVEVEQ